MQIITLIFVAYYIMIGMFVMFMVSSANRRKNGTLNAPLWHFAVAGALWPIVIPYLLFLTFTSRV